MVKQCAWGTYNTDSRYPERLQNGVYFIPFPKPQRDKEKCVMWIRLCGRSEYQQNLSLLPSVCILSFEYTPLQRNVVPFDCSWKKKTFAQNFSKTCFDILSADIIPYVFVIQSGLFVRDRHVNGACLSDRSIGLLRTGMF